MYLGFLLMLSGWWIQLANYFALLGPPLFVLYMNRFQIQPEERALSVTFGQQFQLFKASVRRWL
jgi:protein-S-isoprenylcysteine O-methyltransferase Ste14